MAKIDPAFQAAPYLGDSTHNPIEFARRQNLQKFQMQRAKKEEQDRNTARGLENIMLDIKGWEDQEGFKEIVADQDRIMNGFLQLSRKGLNLVSPKTTQELMAYKAITDAHEQLKQKVDTWNTQKGMYDLIKKAIETDSAKPIDEQRLEREQVISKADEILKTKGIFERGNLLQNLLVTKVQPGDVIKQIIADKSFYIPPSQKQIATPNPETGQIETTFVEDMPEKDTNENVKRAGIRYTGLTEAMKKGVTKMREAETDPLLKVMSDKDYYAALAVPTFRKKFIEKISGTGGGELSINFGGQRVKMSPGTSHPEPIPYGEKVYTNSYMFPLTKPLTIPVGSGGSEQFMGQAWAPIKEGTVEATPYLYNPATEEFVFNTTSNQNAPWVQNNKPISVPRSVIGDLADDFPIKVGSSIKKLKDVYGTMSKPAVKTIGGKDFRTPTYTPKFK